MKADLTQAQLAKRIGTAQSVIARPEGGTDKSMLQRRLPLKVGSAFMTACYTS
jgi:predicted transcriptional regulator